MFELIDFSDAERWNEIVTSFTKYDVYYLHGYVNGFRIHGDGDPVLIYYKTKKLRAVLVVMVRDISDTGYFKGKIERGEYLDIAVPYGYGGFIFEGDTSESELNAFNSGYESFLKENRIISEFIRYNPLINNSHEMSTYTNILDLGGSVTMDLTSEELVWNNLSGQYRSKIKKAEAAGVELGTGDSWELFEVFIALYKETMDHDNATSYYYFTEEYFRSVYEGLKGSYQLFYAKYDGQIISMFLILRCGQYLHYHLSGTRIEFRNLHVTNFILYHVALWGCRNGCKLFHLGSGLGGRDDKLYQFKKYFNRYSTTRFLIGSRLVDKERCDILVAIRAAGDPDFDAESKYFPLYRS